MSWRRSRSQILRWPEAFPTSHKGSVTRAFVWGAASLAQRQGAPPANLRPLAEQVAQLERHAIAQALQVTGGNKVAAARLLGISRATLYERLG